MVNIKNKTINIKDTHLKYVVQERSAMHDLQVHAYALDLISVDMAPRHFLFWHSAQARRVVYAGQKI
jgi:hypothetical protein